jgi:hypothetical protein
VWFNLVKQIRYKIMNRMKNNLIMNNNNLIRMLIQRKNMNKRILNQRKKMYKNNNKTMITIKHQIENNMMKKFLNLKLMISTC